MDRTFAMRTRSILGQGKNIRSAKSRRKQILTLGGSDGLRGPGQAFLSLAALEKPNRTTDHNSNHVRWRQFLGLIRGRTGQDKIALRNLRVTGDLEGQIAQQRHIVGPELRAPKGHRPPVFAKGEMRPFPFVW
jgi:hypothetical protein